MSLRFRRVLLVLIGLLPGLGCASMQRVSVETDPIGAQVFLQRRGEVEVHGRIGVVVGTADVEEFEEEFVLLGHAPIDYEFRRRDREASVQIPDVGAEVTRHYREGTIRIVLDGYQTVVRVVRFSGDPIVLVIQLVPAPNP